MSPGQLILAVGMKMHLDEWEPLGHSWRNGDATCSSDLVEEVLFWRLRLNFSVLFIKNFLLDQTNQTMSCERVSWALPAAGLSMGD